MSLIEGVGDEVTVVVSVFVLLCLVLLAWFSTHTRDIPFVSVIVVELSQRRNRHRNSQQHSQEEGAGQESGGGDTVRVEGQEAGTNNNADSVDDGDDTSPGVAASGSVTPQTVLPQSESAKAEHTVDTPDVSEPPVGEEVDTSSPARQGFSDVSQAECEHSEDTTIPEYIPEDRSPDEVRRRRVAYFESNKGSDKSEQQLDAGSVGAESEQSSLCASQSHQETEGGHTYRDSADPVTPHHGHGETTGGSKPHTTTDRSGLSTDSFPSPAVAAASASDLPSSSTTNMSPGGNPPPSTVLSASQGSLVGEPPLGMEGAQPGAASATPGDQSEERTEVNSESEAADTGVQQIRVRLKYLNDTQRLVYTDPQETIGNFRRLHFSSELGDNKIVRFIFNGQDLRNDLSTLRAYNIADNSVVHCLITQSRESQPGAATRTGGEEVDGQLGAFLYPVFGLILGLVWYLRFSYKQYFNAMSTLSLAGISFIYVLALFSSLRHRRRPHLD